MKAIYFTSVLILVSVCSFSLKAQDFLVTINRDSLNCKLGKLENDQYPISFYHNEKKIDGKIHKDSILFYKKNMFRSLRNNQLFPWYPLKEFSIDAGVAHQFGPFQMEDDLTDKSEFAARTGFYIGTDIAFFMTKTVGYGLKYNYRSLLSGDIRYQYVGPMLALRFWNKNKKDYWFCDVSGGFGWMAQKNAPIQRDLIRPRIEMHAKAITGDFSVGHNFRFSPGVSLRVKLSGIIGYPSFVRISDIQKLVNANDKSLEIGHYCHNMNTINLSVGFTFHSTRPLD